MDLGLYDKHALITGSSKGIGLAIAQGLAAEGCKIAICSRSTKNLNNVLKLLPARYLLDGLLIEADVLKQDDIDRVFVEINEKWNHLDILVNNVGGGGRWGKDLNDTADETWLDIYNKNAMAAVRFTKLAVPLMLKNSWGRVVTIASIYGKEVGINPRFDMAKAAEIALMKNLARKPEYANKGITFNSVAPGYISIPGNNNEFPSSRVGSAEDVAAAVGFLCSEQAKFINGACVVVDGGESRSF